MPPKSKVGLSNGNEKAVQMVGADVHIGTFLEPCHVRRLRKIRWPLGTDSSLAAALQMLRLPVFQRQHQDGFYPAWAFLLPSIMFRLPYSLLKALIFCSLVMGLTGIVGQFARQGSLFLPEIWLFWFRFDGCGCASFY